MSSPRPPKPGKPKAPEMPKRDTAAAPVKPAQVHPANDPPPSKMNTVGKVLPETAPQAPTPKPKARTKLERDQDLARYNQERRDALKRGDRAAAQAADLKAAQVMDEPKLMGDVAAEVGSIAGIFMEYLPGLRGAKRKREPAKELAPAAGHGSAGAYSLGKSVPQDCNIKPYKDQKCPKGHQAHHIVPDYALRYGSRGKGAKGQDRIPGMPSLDDGPTICLSGQARVSGSDHNKAHEGTDPRISLEGLKPTNGPNGTAPIGDIIDISVEEVTKVKPHCADEIKRKTDEAFKNVDRSKYGRTTQQPPRKGSEARATLERGEVHQRGRRTGRRF